MRIGITNRWSQQPKASRHANPLLGPSTEEWKSTKKRSIRGVLFVPLFFELLQKNKRFVIFKNGLSKSHRLVVVVKGKLVNGGLYTIDRDSHSGKRNLSKRAGWSVT